MPQRVSSRRARRPLRSRRRLSPEARRLRVALVQAGILDRHGGFANLLFMILALGAGLVLVASAAFGTAAVVAVKVLESDLPDPSTFESLSFAQPTVIYDRTGKVELGRFELEKRRIVTFDQIPTLVLDATTAAEDRTFWQNEGVDPAAIAAAVVQNLTSDGERGASTITQQLVRARLLPQQYLAPGADRYLRKAKELVQAMRLTSAYPGEDGKKRIITAYLNQAFYGHGAYGIAAAASIYFGIDDLRKLTPAQAALLAGLPKSPTYLDPFQYAKKDNKGRLVVPLDSPPVQRRAYVLQGLTNARWTHLTGAQLETSLSEPVVLARENPVFFKAPQFVWQVRNELEQILPPNTVETGGYRVITTLDMRAQTLAEKEIEAAAILPNMPEGKMQALIKSLHLGADESWITGLRHSDLHNGAMVAMDYRTGDVLAYVGSAGYYRTDLASHKFDPQFDVAGIGYRQPGSAFKPVMYSTGFEQRKFTPGTLLLDISTPFSPEWTPADADKLERGPVRLRQALQYSLNIPAIRAMERVGSAAVAKEAAAMGISFQGGRKAFLEAGLAGAIGTVELRVIDLTSAFGTIANSGARVPPRLVLKVFGPDGSVVYDAGQPKPKQVLSPQSAFLTTDILAGNTDPSQNLIWGPMFHLNNGPDGPNGQRRPAALKTGTTDDFRDLSAYGFVAPPANQSKPALVVGVWMGNSDHSIPQADRPIFAASGPARVWHAFLRDYLQGQPIAQFPRPSTGLVQTRIDAWSGGRPGPWTRRTVEEWFLDGTQPGAPGAIDPPGLLYTHSDCGWAVNPMAAELGPQAWQSADANWAARASHGPGTGSRTGTRTAYLFGQSGWGGRIVGPCPPPEPTPPPVCQPGNDGNGNGNGKGNGNGNGHPPDPCIPPPPPGDGFPVPSPSPLPTTQPNRPHRRHRSRRRPPAVPLSD